GQRHAAQLGGKARTQRDDLHRRAPVASIAQPSTRPADPQGSPPLLGNGLRSGSRPVHARPAMIPPSATWLRSRANVGTAVNRCDVPERDVVRSSPPPFRRAPAATPARRGRAPAAVGGENRQERGQ